MFCLYIARAQIYKRFFLRAYTQLDIKALGEDRSIDRQTYIEDLSLL